MLTAAKGRATLTSAGKQAIAKSMFGKGCAFLGAYILLRQKDQSEPTEYVALHNLCQSVELILKSLLLLRDYNQFQPKLGRRGGLGHDLIALLNEVTKLYPMHKPSAKSIAQLQQLNSFYVSHRLRYGTGADLFFAPHAFERNRVVRLLAFTIKSTISSNS